MHRFAAHHGHLCTRSAGRGCRSGVSGIYGAPDRFFLYLLYTEDTPFGWGPAVRPRIPACGNRRGGGIGGCALCIGLVAPARRVWHGYRQYGYLWGNLPHIPAVVYTQTSSYSRIERNTYGERK